MICKRNMARAGLKNHFRSALWYNLRSFGCRRPLRRPHSDKISYTLGLAAHDKPFSDTL